MAAGQPDFRETGANFVGYGSHPPDEQAADVPERRIGRRTHSRLRVFIPAKLISVFGTQQVLIQNLSQSGIKLRWTEPVRAASDVVIVWSHHELFGKIVWAESHYGGVLLEEPLSQVLILSMRARDEAHGPQQGGDASAWYLENLRYNEGRRWRA